MSRPVPLVSIVVPVYDRLEELRRALRSVADQTLSSFECIVVDDASTQPVESVVAEFDSRFHYVRRDTNGGPTAARMTGLKRITGELVVGLDSDNEFFPWTFARAAHYLDQYPSADGATGLIVFPDGLRVRIAKGAKIAGPDEFAARSSPANDSLRIVRRCVAERWLSSLRPDYFMAELVFSLSFRLNHTVVLVDEPWGRYHTASTNRVSPGPPDPRWCDDCQKFMDQFRPVLGAAPCGPVDNVLIQMCAGLVRAHRYREAAAIAHWMRERGIPLRTAVQRKALWALQRRMPVGSQVHVF